MNHVLRCLSKGLDIPVGTGGSDTAHDDAARSSTGAAMAAPRRRKDAMTDFILIRPADTVNLGREDVRFADKLDCDEDTRRPTQRRSSGPGLIKQKGASLYPKF
jgi:hypothetical protein